MGAFTTLIDVLLFFFFIVIAVAAPLLEGPTCLPINYCPDILVDIQNWYTHEFGDYLVAEKPAFFVGLVWLELLFLWPLAIANLYAIVASKSWFKTTCLISGVYTFTSTVAMIAELMSSGRASDKLLALYFPFLGFAVLAMLRGLLPCSKGSTSSTGRKALLDHGSNSGKSLTVVWTP